MKPRRILFVDHAPIVGGGQLSLAEHLRALDKSRFEPFVACSSDAPELHHLYRDAGAEVHPIALPRLRSVHPATVPRLLGSAWALRRLVQALRVDLVVTSTSRTAYVAAIGLLASGIPLVWWVRDFLFGRRVFRLLSKSATHIICVSEALRRFYGGEGDRRFSVIVVGSTLHHQLASVTADAVRAERTRWAFEPEDIVVGFMGRLVEEKGIEDVLDAAVEAHRREPRLKLLIVGTGRHQMNSVEDRIRARVADNGWSFVRFAGFQSAEALYYRVFDIVVLASREHEGYGMSAVQAMMAGTPVIATAVGGTPELVRDHETGLLVAPGSSAEMSEAVLEIMANPVLRGRLVSAAREAVMRNNREEVTTAQAERLYDSLLGSPGTTTGSCVTPDGAAASSRP